MNEIINIVGLLQGFLFAWLFVNFEPLQKLINKYVLKYLIKWKQTYIANALSCHKCMSFWVTMAITLDPLTAIAAAFLAYTYLKIMSSFRTFV